MGAFLKYTKKAIVGLVMVAATGAAYNIFPDPWDKVANAVIAVGAYYGIYRAKNGPNPSVKVETDKTAW